MLINQSDQEDHVKQAGSFGYGFAFFSVYGVPQTMGSIPES
jgi:hypothetical protein